ncbi:hypothetical protein [Sphingomonas abietis]|uniref:Uncharacterized protein n=1 Tax=Sphingomonas abietis TaxID=3012344 RepID=A0ABY7NTS0_9SPHN|nr:hypothetical protein [Sphingomonas abietis]WBO22851.1 hypothetical protein PBT88_01475 [Sphingomonas abietis]
MRSSAAIAQTGFRFAEMAQASQVVIGSRTRTIMASTQGANGADQRELARMLPEKIEAFSLAGMAAFGDMVALQGEAFAAWRQLAGMAMSGRVPTATEIETLARHGHRMADRAISASGKALAPIHRQATGNARRLSRPKPGRS